MEKANPNMKGFIGTILFHAIVIALLLILGLTTPLPLPAEQGVEVNLGYDDQGMGTVQTLEPPANAEQTSQSSMHNEEEDIIQQNTEEAPSIKASKKKAKEITSPNKTTKTQADKATKETSPTVNPLAIYKGKSKNSSTGQNEGETGKPGDQGNPLGSPDAKNHYGTPGSGGGISFSLSGRSSTYLPKPPYQSKEQGIVVVAIWVNKNGQVTRSEAGIRGTTTSDPSLWKLAREAALKAKFSANPDAPEEQKGTITYNFIRLN